MEGRDFTYVDCGEDVTVLAGDICTAASTECFRRLAQRIPHPIVYVLGNHEYYRSNQIRADHASRMRLFTSSLPGVALLDNEHIDIKGYRFIGSTLWTDFRLPHARLTRERIMEGITQAVNDFQHIRADNNHVLRASALDMEQWSLECQRYLEGAIDSSPKPVVVVTHFMPSPKSIAKHFEGEALNTYFCCDVTRLFKPPVALWLHGHTHDACTYEQSGVRVYCNPRGYKGEKSGYDSNLVIELPEAKCE